MYIFMDTMSCAPCMDGLYVELNMYTVYMVYVCSGHDVYVYIKMYALYASPMYAMKCGHC